MKKTKVLWLVYKRLRTAFGVTLGFVVIYGAYTKNLNFALLPIAIGFYLIQLAGDLYNDSQNYAEDTRNLKPDKWTTQGLMGKENVRLLSVLSGLLGLSILLFTNLWVFLLGLVCAFTGIAYSHPSINLKQKEVFGYLLVSIPVFFFPFVWNTYFQRMLTTMDIYFGFFCGFHYLYLYFQKDATDNKDEMNVFIGRGWENASVLTVLFSTLALLFFTPFTFISIPLFLVWVTLASANTMNLYLIFTRKISWKVRSRLVLIKFLVPYMYVGASFI